jgi:hypothetical protein
MDDDDRDNGITITVIAPRRNIIATLIEGLGWMVIGAGLVIVYAFVIAQ